VSGFVEIRIRIKVVAEEYQNRGSFDYFLVSWAEDPAFVVPGKDLPEAISELVSFLVATIVHLMQTPDEQLAAEAKLQKHRFELMLARG